MENKRNFKEERGITLLALIITIIILAILALITVNAAYMSGIIQFGVNGAKDYAQVAIEENRIMEETGNYVESVTKKIKVLLGEEPPTNPELTGMDWFVKGVTEPAVESKEVADFYARGKPDGTLIIYPKNGVEATIEYVEQVEEDEVYEFPPWDQYLSDENEELAPKIKSVYVAKGMKADSCQFLFEGLLNCTTIDLTNLNTSQVTAMNGMFVSCSSLSSIDLTELDTKQVTDMRQMFQSCENLEDLNLSHLDMSNVMFMQNMFANCKNLKSLDLPPLESGQLTDMSLMFEGCASLIGLDLSHLDTSRVTNMRSMFKNCTSLARINLSSLETGQVTDMSYMFSGCKSLGSLDLMNFDVRKVKNFNFMFNRM